MIRASDSSRIFVSLGRSMIRGPEGAATVAVPLSIRLPAAASAVHTPYWVLLRRRRGRRARRSARQARLLPSAPWADRERGRQLGEGVVAGERPVRGRDLPPTRDAELLSEDVRVRLRRPGRDAEARADFLVRAAGRDELDDLPLPVGDRERRSRRFHRFHHGATVRGRPRVAY